MSKYYTIQDIMYNQNLFSILISAHYFCFPMEELFIFIDVIILSQLKMHLQNLNCRVPVALFTIGLIVTLGMFPL